MNLQGSQGPCSHAYEIGMSCRVRGGPTAPKGAVRMSLQGATPSVPVPVTIITGPSREQVCFTKPCALAATMPF